MHENSHKSLHEIHIRVCMKLHIDVCMGSLHEVHMKVSRDIEVCMKVHKIIKICYVCIYVNSKFGNLHKSLQWTSHQTLQQRSPKKLHSMLMFTGCIHVCRSHCIKVCTKFHTKNWSWEVALLFAGHIEYRYFDTK